MPDEQLTSDVGLVTAERDDAVGDQRDAVQGDPLVGQRGLALLRPVRLGVGALDQVAAEPLGPQRVDRGVLARVEPRGLDQLGRHHQVGLRLEQPRAGEDREPRAAGAEVVAAVAVAQADVREQAGEQRLVDPVLVRPLALGGGVSRPEPDLLGHLTQLRLEVLPLPDAQVVEVLLPAHPPEGARAHLLLLRPEVPPEVDPGQEVRARVAEARVQLVGTGPVLDRSLARVLDRQRRGDHQHVAQAALPVGLEDHPGHPRVDRQPGELAADAGQLEPRSGATSALGGPGQRAELLQQLYAGPHGPLVGRVHEREPLDLARARARSSGGSRSPARCAGSPAR